MCGKTEKVGRMSYLLCVCVSPQHVFEAEARFQHSVALHRQKREWIVPPQILDENVDYTKREFIAKVSEPFSNKRLTGSYCKLIPRNKSQGTSFFTREWIFSYLIYLQFKFMLCIKITLIITILATDICRIIIC